MARCRRVWWLDPRNVNAYVSFCGASLPASETRTASAEVLARDRTSSRPTWNSSRLGIGDAHLCPVVSSRHASESSVSQHGQVVRLTVPTISVPTNSVALKPSTTLGASPSEALARFVVEVRWLARSLIPCFRVFDIGEAEHGITCPWNTSMAKRRPQYASASDGCRRRSHRCPEAASCRSAAADDHGVLHRDLKPANVMLDGRGRVRIMDFGLAMYPGERIDRIAGTPATLLRDRAGREPTERSDIFRLA